MCVCVCVCVLKENARLCHSFIQSSDHVNQREMNRNDDSVYGLCFSGEHER